MEIRSSGSLPGSDVMTPSRLSEIFTSRMTCFWDEMCKPMETNFKKLIEYQKNLEGSNLNAADIHNRMVLLMIMERPEQSVAADKTPTSHTQSVNDMKSPKKISAHLPKESSEKFGGRASRQHSDDEKEGRDKRKRRKLNVDNEDGDTRKRLKCPYFLRRPDKYRRGSCRGEGFADMGKLKDHLKRVHQKAQQCSRCWREFCTEETYTAHLKLDPKCEEQPEPEDDRVSAATLRGLNFSRIPYANRTVEEKWKRLYMDLFPGEDEVPSPYEEYGLGPDFDKLLAIRLEQELSSEFGPLAERNNNNKLYEKLVEIIRDCRKVKGSTNGEYVESLSRSRAESVVSSEADVAQSVNISSAPE